LANGEETIPTGGRDDAAAVRSKELRLKVEWPKEVAGRIGERNSGGPSHKFGRVRRGGRGKEVNGPKVHDAVDGAEREAVPLGPPTALWLAERFVRGMLEEKVNVVHARSRASGAVGVGSGQGKIDLNQVPARPRSVSGYIRDEEEAVRAGSKRSSERRGSRGRGESGYTGDLRKRVHGSKGWKGARVDRIQ
jgi:hypothetical protein